MQIPKPHGVLVCSPGTGHLIPVLELGKRLVNDQNFTVTILVVASHHDTSFTKSQFLRSSMNSPAGRLCNIVELPPVDISGKVHRDAAVVTVIAETMREMKPAIRSAISAMEIPPTVLIVDFFATEAMEIADEIGIPKYFYMSSNAWFLALSVYLPILDKAVKGEYSDLAKPLKIPGCKPVKPESVIIPMLDRSNQQYSEFVRIGNEISKADGILVNTWEGLEPTTITALRDNEKLLSKNLPIYAVGPLMRPVESPRNQGQLMVFGWLDKQPNESVILVSFGSGGTLSYEQMKEVAYGLEKSQQRFIWVVRAPTVTNGDASFFTCCNRGDDPSSYLPEGFIRRTHEVGLLLPTWAPQVDILNHPSVGGFLTHCGWNSILESITNGVPMIAWPLYAEQRMNAALLTEELGVAVAPEEFTRKEVVGREEIAKMVRKIMVNEDGLGIRAKVKDLKRSAEKALCVGGSSDYALSQFAKSCEI